MENETSTNYLQVGAASAPFAWKFCPFCGKEIGQGWFYCAHCGQQFQPPPAQWIPYYSTGPLTTPQWPPRHGYTWCCASTESNARTAQ